jgi:transposase-like protein
MTEREDNRSGRYPRELKEEAIRRVIDGREPVAHVCQELNIKPGSLYFALRKFEVLTRSD